MSSFLNPQPEMQGRFRGAGIQPMLSSAIEQRRKVKINIVKDPPG
jgi:hypothetical protein